VCLDLDDDELDEYICSEEESRQRRAIFEAHFGSSDSAGLAVLTEAMEQMIINQVTEQSIAPTTESEDTTQSHS
jgi:hypothetical protein